MITASTPKAPRPTIMLTLSWAEEAAPMPVVLAMAMRVPWGSAPRFHTMS